MSNDCKNIGAALVVKEFEHNGKKFNVIKMANPDAWDRLPDLNWDYKKFPYGPGTIAWGRKYTPQEIFKYTDNFILMRLDNSPLEVVEMIIVNKEEILGTTDKHAINRWSTTGLTDELVPIDDPKELYPKLMELFK